MILAPVHSTDRVLAGGGEMGALMRSIDWSDTSLGPVAGWPQSLRTAVSMMLESRFAMVVAWGPDFTFLYNDRYRPVLGATKHPAAMGRPARDIFPEVWHFIGPLFEQARRGDAVALDDVLIPLDRNGYLEECFFTLSYSPIRDESAGVGGMLAVVAETTERVQGERRLRTLSAMAGRSNVAASVAGACQTAAAALAQNPADVPFSLFYVREAGGARLIAQSGLDAAAEAAAPGRWPLGDGAQVVERLQLPGGACPEPCHTAIVLPLVRPGQEQPYGHVVFGVSPRCALAPSYRTFFELAAEHIVAAITHARAYEEERRRAESLAELDRAKTAFFSNISHEFRTPLTLMLGPAEDLLAGLHGGLEAPARAQVATLQRNAQRLLKLVNTLLDFARIEAGRVEAVYEPTDLAAFTADLASNFRAAVERAGLALVVACTPTADPVYVDRDLWEKIVLNLLSNAFKFTFDGEIRVELRQVDARAVLEVSDTGIGIAADQLPDLFRRFHRVKGARARTHEGSGIGLAFVLELVKMHGGTVDVESEPERGTRFRVAIPTGTAHLPVERIGAERTLASTSIGAGPFVAEALRWLPAASSVLPAELPGPDARSSGPAISGRVLVADDNGDMRNYLRRLLEPRYAVELAGDGAAALEAIRRQPPDLVLSDVMMPEVDGLELVRRLRADPRTAALPVILLSARAGEEARIEGLDSGADDYLVKPFSPRELLARVRAHLEMVRLREQMSAERSALRETAHRLQTELHAFVDGTDGMLSVKDLAGRYLMVNRQFERVLGRPRAAIIGRTDDELFPPDEARCFGAEDRRIVETGEGVQVDCTLEGPDGRRDYLMVKFPLREQGGRPYAIGAIATDVTEQRRMQARLLEESRVNETLHRLGASFAKELDEERLLQLITDEATRAIGADRGAFFLGVKDDSGESLMLYTVSGKVPGEAAGFPLAGATPLFAETFRGEAIVRLDDVRTDPRFGELAPPGEPAVASYLAVPVIGRSGEVLGGLFFAHAKPGRFTEDHELVISGIAGHAVVALDNAQLYGALRKSQEAARVAYERAALADRRKDEFLAMLGHELRNPLAPIVTALQLIRLRGQLHGDKELGVIERQVRHLSRLVDDLLDVSRITRGKIELSRGVVEVATVVARAIEMASPLIEQRRHMLAVDVPPHGLAVSADAMRLAQVLSNLLTNAAKYTDPGGEITVRAHRDGDAAAIHVRDTGVGIPRELLSSVFELFTQGPRSIDRSQGGLGIGLTLVRSLVEMHGGTVRALSDGPGTGSEFVVRLPALPAPTAIESASPAPSRPPRVTFGPRILVVDDNEDAARTMAVVLEELGHCVEVAHDPPSALARAPAFRPTIALIDIGLPVMDGYELGRRLRQLEGMGELRMIAVSGYGQQEDRRRSQQTGFESHLVKPVDLETLLRAISS